MKPHLTELLGAKRRSSLMELLKDLGLDPNVRNVRSQVRMGARAAT